MAARQFGTGVMVGAMPVPQQVNPGRRAGDHFWPLPAAIWPAVIFVYACLLPAELTFEISGVTIWPYRIAGIAVVPLLFAQAAREPWRRSWLDLLAALVLFWLLMSIYLVDGMEVLLIKGLALGGDFTLAYIIGRICIKNIPEFRSFLFAILPGLLVISLIIVAESFLGQFILRPTVARLVGVAFEISPERRLGLVRGMGPFPHPILAGVLLTSLLPIYWLSFKNWIIRLVGTLVALLGFFTLSSTSYLGLFIGMAMVALLEIQRRLLIPAFIIAGGYILFALVFIAIVSENGVLSVISRYVLLTPASGSYREIIWEYGLAEIARSPVLGIGQRDWIRPVWMFSSSIDAYWLETSMRYGIPMGLLLFGLSIGAIIAAIRSSGSFRLASNRNVHIGIAMSLVVIVFSGFTVHIWEGPARWFELLLGIAISLSATARSIEPRAMVGSSEFLQGRTGDRAAKRTPQLPSYNGKITGT